MSRSEVDVRVVHGAPTPEEVAAVVAAVNQARAQDARDRPRQLPAWLRAAWAEGVGGPPVASPADLPAPTPRR